VSHAPYLLPYVRVELLVHTIRSTTWDAATWPLVREQIPRVMEMREQVAKDGWWD
jgi:hypothetical protein